MYEVLPIPLGDLKMKFRTSLYLLPIALTTSFGMVGACGGDEAAGDGDGDSISGDGDTGGVGGVGGMLNVCDAECKDDKNPCTEDVCNPDTGECGIPRSGNTCDDGIYCNGNDTCDEGDCAEHSGIPCAEGFECDEGQNSCGCTTAAHCDNGVFCDGAEACTGGECEDGTPPVCADGIQLCHPDLDQCVACIPGTYRCEDFSADEVIVKCDDQGQWPVAGSSSSSAIYWIASCLAGQGQVCDAATGKCKTGFLDPRDLEFEIPELLRGLPALEKGLRTDDVLNLAIRSEFG